MAKGSNTKTLVKKAIFDQLREVEMAEVPERPENCFTKTEYAAEMGVSTHTAERRLRALVAKGILERIRIRVLDSNGQTNVRGAYVLKTPLGAAGAEQNDPGR